MPAARTLSPRNVAKFKDLCDMPQDNFEANNHWILTDLHRVTIAAQRLGETPTQEITVPRKTFDKLIDWYMREQKMQAE